MKSLIVLWLLASSLFGSTAWADAVLKPFLIFGEQAGSVAEVAAATESRLGAGGFSVVGGYSPYPGAHVIGITSDALLAAAAKSGFGGYGAVLRISVTEAGGKVQVASVNPDYMAAVYRMQDLAAVSDSLKAALGGGTPYGSESGLTAKDLGKYHYMAFMPYFDDHDELGSFGSQAEALARINERLASGTGGMRKVYEVAIPGKDESVIGVALTQGDGADAYVMERVDIGSPKSTAHLPYEVLVSGGKVYSLAGKFRIAQSFPDLTMATFGKIMSSPGAIRDSLAKLVE